MESQHDLSTLFASSRYNCTVRFGGAMEINHIAALFFAFSQKHIRECLTVNAFYGGWL